MHSPYRRVLVGERLRARVLQVLEHKRRRPEEHDGVAVRELEEELPDPVPMTCTAIEGGPAFVQPPNASKQICIQKRGAPREVDECRDRKEIAYDVDRHRVI